MSGVAHLASAPDIETERLALRRHKLEDFEVYASIWGDPAVTRYIGGTPLSREAAWVRFLRHGGHWALMGYGFWAIEEKSSGRLIGESGFLEARRELTPSIEGTPEIGWMLSPAAQGKGYAAEALVAILGWGEKRFAGKSFVCLIDLDNLRSNRLAEKFGFREDIRTTYHDAPLAIWRRAAGTS